MVPHWWGTETCMEEKERQQDLNSDYYQYARQNDKLPSLKRAFLRAKRVAKREMRGISFQCHRWREFILGHFVVL